LILELVQWALSDPESRWGIAPGPPPLLFGIPLSSAFLLTCDFPRSFADDGFKWRRRRIEDVLAKNKRLRASMSNCYLGPNMHYKLNYPVAQKKTSTFLFYG